LSGNIDVLSVGADGKTILGLTNTSNLQGFDAQSVALTYAGSNNYRIERVYSALGAGYIGFYLIDIDTNTRVSTKPTSSDFVHVSNYGLTRQILSFSNVSSNNFLNNNEVLLTNNFWVSGLLELWLKVDIVSDTSLKARWQSKSGVTTYKLYRDTNEDFSTATLVYSGTDLEYTDTSLTADTLYYYRLDDQTDTEISRFWIKTKSQ